VPERLAAGDAKRPWPEQLGIVQGSVAAGDDDEDVLQQVVRIGRARDAGQIAAK
jgi:hypothetical protein